MIQRELPSGLPCVITTKCYLYPSTLEVRLLDSIPDKQPKCESIKYRPRYEVWLWVSFFLPHCYESIFTQPSLQATSE